MKEEFSELSECNESLKHELGSMSGSSLLPVSSWCCASISVSYRRGFRFEYYFYKLFATEFINFSENI